MSASATRARDFLPALGEHTAGVLREAGFSDAEIAGGGLNARPATLGSVTPQRMDRAPVYPSSQCQRHCASRA